MSDLDQATATLALGDEDEICEWYRRPVIGGPAYPRFRAGRGVLEYGLCAECASINQAFMGARLDTSSSHKGQPRVTDASGTRILLRGEYTFQKPYSQLRADAKFCALCRTIEDSVALTQAYAAGHNPTPIPPGSHVHLDPVTSSRDEWIGLSVSIADDENTRDHDSDTSSSDASGGNFKSNPRRKGYLEVEFHDGGPAGGVDKLLFFDAIKQPGYRDMFGPSYRKAAPWRDMTQMLHSWLQECDSVHGVCQQHKNSRRSSTDVDTSASPTRLLEIHQVGGRFHVRLVAGTGNGTRYIALSHRWGDYSSSRTTTANIERYRSGINFDSLPLTLRQAIQITHAAGVRFLWVDCLCIIQDDDNDWAQEAPRMGSIYASAYFTIAASAFQDEGCFPLKFSEVHHATIHLRPGFKLKISPRSSDFDDWAIEYEPLQKRAWTLQERLLSQRILYCSRYEYYWLCREQRLRAWGSPGGWFGYTSVLPAADSHVSPLLLSYSAQSRKAALSQWYLLLFDYSNRQLTLEKDKFIAINGLVNIFQRWIGSTYLHGLWECDLACGLAWHPGSHWSTSYSDSSERDIKMFGADKPRFWRTFPNRAPSWSWASADGFQEHLGAEFSWLAEGLGQPLSDLAYIKATIASEDEHGSCLGGELSAEPQLLKVCGRLMKAFYGHQDTEEHDDRVWQVDFRGDPKVFHFIADDPDLDPGEDSKDSESSKFYVLPIIAYMGLVITPAGDDDVPLYRRVGTANFMIPFLSEISVKDSSEGSAAAFVDEGAEYAVDTGSVSSSNESSISSGIIPDYVPGFSKYWREFAQELRWLGKIGTSDTIFLC